MVVLGQSGCILSKSGCIRAKWLYSGKSGSIWATYLVRAKVVVFEQNLLYSSNVVEFGQS